jgi:ADP-L-glycero-D-manno-heptose 6-epimerase
VIIVTGGAGFIGSNLVRALCGRGAEVLVVDHREADHGYLADCAIVDYLDVKTFLEKLAGEEFREAKHIFHLGACSDTTVRDGRYMMQTNYACSKEVLRFCRRHRVPLVYASSAAVYGQGEKFVETPECEAPVNVYGYSKYLFDCYVRRIMANVDSQLVGLRYFNVYGPREHHKGTMASVALHLTEQLKTSDQVRLFRGSDGYGDGEQRRDFVHVDDVVAATLWFMDHPDCSGIFNVGTGAAARFNDVATAVLAWHQRGEIDYIAFPEHLKGAYQSYTQADIGALRKAGYRGDFRPVQLGVKHYLDWLAGAG